MVTSPTMHSGLSIAAHLYSRTHRASRLIIVSVSSLLRIKQFIIFYHGRKLLARGLKKVYKLRAVPADNSCASWSIIDTALTRSVSLLLLKPRIIGEVTNREGPMVQRKLPHLQARIARRGIPANRNLTNWGDLVYWGKERV